jgi:hypothetical protein
MDNFSLFLCILDTKCNFVARRRKRLDAVEVVIHLFRDTSRECCDDLEMSHVT